MRILLASLIALSAACSQPPAEPAAPAATGPAEDQITEAALVQHVQTLSSDEMEGRAPSTPGGQRAAQYIADQMKAMGVEPAADNGSYFQEVPIVESTVNRSTTSSASFTRKIYSR